MSISSIEELIGTTCKDKLDSNESEALYAQVQGLCRDFQRNKIKAGICFHLIERYELYKIEGEKDTRSLLKSWGFSNGTISHGIAYGEFCCMMKFRDDQIPPEYVVRSLLVQELKSEWCNIYRAACTLALKKYVMSDADMSPGESSAARNTTGDDEHASDNESNTPQNTTDAEEILSQSDDIEDVGDEENDDVKEDVKEEGEQEDDDPLNENSLPLLKHSAATDTLLSNKPTMAELKQVIQEYQKRDQTYIHLFAISEKMPREEDFASALEKYKKKLKTVSVLCHVVRDYKSGGGNLTENDTAAIHRACTEIRIREDEQLENTINGDSDDGNGEVPGNEDPEE